jgi:CheY-like chemotaxis protein
VKPVSILYVEDSEDLRDTIGMLLEGPDREVKTCATGEEALDAYAEQDFDILVTDVSLPGLSGTDLARKLLAERADRWIVLCSGYEFSEHLHLFGPNVRSLRKPFEPDDLDTLMNEIVESVATS